MIPARLTQKKKNKEAQLSYLNVLNTYEHSEYNIKY